MDAHLVNRCVCVYVYIKLYKYISVLSWGMAGCFFWLIDGWVGWFVDGSLICSRILK